MKSLFSSEKKGEKVVLIFDIGSASVGGAFVKIENDNNKLPVILDSFRSEIINKDRSDFNLYLRGMLDALYVVIQKLHKDNLYIPSEILCTLASPWYVSETKLIKVSRQKMFTFDQNLVDELIKKEIIDSSNKKKDAVLIEHPIVGVVLDGKHVSNPVGKKAYAFEINMLMSFSTELCLDKIKQTISKVFHNENINFSSFVLSSYLSIRDRYIHESSYMIIDIAGEITDIAIISDGILKEVTTFPFGRNTLIRNISNSLKLEIRDAKEKFNLFNNNILSEKEKDKLIPILKVNENTWVKYFENSLINQAHLISGVMFLTVDPCVKNWFINIIKNEENIQKNVLNKKFTVLSLEGQEFLNMCDIKTGNCDPFLMMEAISFVRKM